MDMAATASKMRMTGMANLSAPARARITGVVYLLFFVTAIAGAIVMPVAGGPGGPSGDAAAEGLLMLWLLVLGVNGRRWAQLAGQP